MVSTKGYGGRKLAKSITVFTNDPKQEKATLRIMGNVDKFVTIIPRRVNLRGNIGQDIRQSVTIIPEPEYPFKILSASVDKEDYFTYELSNNQTPKGKGYRLDVANTRTDEGSYVARIILKTDSEIQPELVIRVIGNIKSPAGEETKSPG